MLKAKVCRLTEKNMANQKFRQSETAILIAYLGSRGCPTAKFLAQKARVSRSTFYLHHQQPHNIPRDYEEYLFGLYKKHITKFLKKESTNLKTLFFHTLIFISSHQKIFRMLFFVQQKGIIKRMLSCLKKPILAEWRLAGNLDELYCVYENEIIGVIETWDKQGFAGGSFNATLKHLVYLTRTAPRRLTFLIKI